MIRRAILSSCSSTRLSQSIGASLGVAWRQGEREVQQAIRRRRVPSLLDDPKDVLQVLVDGREIPARKPALLARRPQISPGTRHDRARLVETACEVGLRGAPDGSHHLRDCALIHRVSEVVLQAHRPSGDIELGVATSDPRPHVQCDDETGFLQQAEMVVESIHRPVEHLR